VWASVAEFVTHQVRRQPSDPVDNVGTERTEFDVEKASDGTG
jgi:hypothetical protein